MLVSEAHLKSEQEIRWKQDGQALELAGTIYDMSGTQVPQGYAE